MLREDAVWRGRLLGKKPCTFETNRITNVQARGGKSGGGVGLR
jgi:hypothetical protein